MEKRPKKLILNQETLRNLNEDELQRIQGGLFTKAPIPTCPECPSPPDTSGCLR